jgi:hypothetical protein
MYLIIFQISKILNILKISLGNTGFNYQDFFYKSNSFFGNICVLKSVSFKNPGVSIVNSFSSFLSDFNPKNSYIEKFYLSLKRLITK